MYADHVLAWYSQKLLGSLELELWIVSESACGLLEINWSNIRIASALNRGALSPAFKGVLFKTMFKDIIYAQILFKNMNEQVNTYLDYI